MIMKRYFFFVLFFPMVMVPIIPIHAESLEDKLKNALEDMLEEKVDEVLGKDKDKQDKPKTAHLKFTGAEDLSPEILTPLSGSVLDTAVPPPVLASTDPEKECYDMIQGKIAWNNANNKSWAANNVNQLCRGTTKAKEPGSCFSYVLFNGNDWGKTTDHSVSWKEASDLCSGTSDSTATTRCFKLKIAARQSLSEAIGACTNAKPVRAFIPRAAISVAPVTTFTRAEITPTATLTRRDVAATTLTRTISVNQEKACFDYVQGKIAWDNAGAQKTWSPANVNRLCKNTASNSAPGDCFKYILFDGHMWGKRASDEVAWQQALDLCEGISNNQETTSCFKNSIAAGSSLTDAIKQCERRGITQ
jgi:hypothetical protein